MRDAACVILAAGQGKRMRSARPKVLHPVAGRSMLGYPIEVARQTGIRKIITVIGHGGEAVKRAYPNACTFVWQRKQAGTADAVRKATPELKGFRGNVLVLCGDAPLLRLETVKALLRAHRRSSAQATILSATVTEPFGYGRVLRDRAGQFLDIREERDASGDERRVREINTGAYVFYWPAFVDCLDRIRNNNRQSEWYLTDAPRLMRDAGRAVHITSCHTPDEAIGINNRMDLAEANAIMNRRILDRHMLRGITIMDPTTTYIEDGVRIGRDTTVYPFTFIEKGVRIGRHCSIGPFAKIRSGSVIGDKAVVGSFVEVVRTKIGRKTFVKHLAYLGDARVGAGVNIGAGTITANFDGRHKHRTVIEDGAFIGSDTILIAPIRVGKKGRTGAGSVVLRGRHVRPGSTVAGVPSRPVKRAKRKQKR